MRNCSRSDLVDIFYCGGNQHRADLQLVTDILYLLENSFLNLDTEVIQFRESYYRCIDDIRDEKIAISDIAGGSNGHMALKYLAGKHYTAIGANHYKFENEFHGYRPDLISVDQSILIECGTVNPDKVFAYFEYKIVERLICIPYPDEKEEIIAFTFEPTEDTAEFLLFLREQKIQALKKMP